MHAVPQEISLDVMPSSRFDIIEMSKLVLEKLTVDRALYQKATYTSFHTTAGYLEQSLVARLHYEKERIAGSIRLSPDDLMERGIKAAEQLGLKKDDTIVFY